MDTYKTYVTVQFGYDDQESPGPREDARGLGVVADRGVVNPRTPAAAMSMNETKINLEESATYFRIGRIIRCEDS